MSPKSKHADGRSNEDPIVTLLSPMCIRVNFDAETNEVIIADIADRAEPVIIVDADYFLAVIVPAVQRKMKQLAQSPSP